MPKYQFSRLPSVAETSVDASLPLADLGTDVPVGSTVPSNRCDHSQFSKEALPAGATKRNLTKLSHRLSLGLRHKAVEFGWHIAPDGFVPVQEILDHRMFQIYTLRDIAEVVQSNDKQRYTLQDRPLENYFESNSNSATDIKRTVKDNTNSMQSIIAASSGHDGSSRTQATILCIRANQGHSIATINPDMLLQRLSTHDLLQNYTTMVHGTFYASWKKIQSSGGLSKMNRNHIHFATGIPNFDGTKDTVISGMRRSCDVYIYVNVPKCVMDNIAIYKSDNGVLLTAGVDDLGILPIIYFSHVTDSSGNVLFKND